MYCASLLIFICLKRNKTSLARKYKPSKGNITGVFLKNLFVVEKWP